MSPKWLVGILVASVCERSIGAFDSEENSARRPSFVLCMADDQGWGDVGFRGDSVLKTPVLDEMARNGLRLDRFYAAAPVCSPTRGSVLTGRHPNRFRCFSWGHTLDPREVTIAERLRDAGYATGHFGKWHLGSVAANGLDSPGASGFDEWLSTPNFYENDPLMSHRGAVVDVKGESSAIVVDAAIEFMRRCDADRKPFLTVIWFGSPHLPHQAVPLMREGYADNTEAEQNFYGEIAGIDAAMGTLRAWLRQTGIAEETLLWYTSDNGALPIGSTGGLRGRKGDLDEGGLRVPAMLEWPGVISPRVVDRPSGTVDILPTLLELAHGRESAGDVTLDGVSITSLWSDSPLPRAKPLGFWVMPSKGVPMHSRKILEALTASSTPDAATTSPDPWQPRDPADVEDAEPVPGAAAWIDGSFKLHRRWDSEGQVTYQLYDLSQDPGETHDLSERWPDRCRRMEEALERWQRDVIHDWRN